jgi:hypothetical protein
LSRVTYRLVWQTILWENRISTRQFTNSFNLITYDTFHAKLRFAMSAIQMSPKEIVLNSAFVFSVGKLWEK